MFGFEARIHVIDKVKNIIKQYHISVLLHQFKIALRYC